MLPGIGEGADLDKFGDMKAAGGAGHGRVVSPLLGRALDASLQEAQGPPAVMETEIARRTEAEVARRMSIFQQQFTGAHDGQWEDPRGFLAGQGREEQYADVDVTVQGRAYPPPPFGRAGAAMGPIMRNNASQLYRASLGGQPTPVDFSGGAQQQWLPERLGAAQEQTTFSTQRPSVYVSP